MAGGGLLALAGTLTGGEAVGALRTALRTIDPFEALAMGWSKLVVLRDYGKTRGSGTVRLGTHTLHRDLHPVVIFTVGALPSKPIRFTLMLDARNLPVGFQACDHSSVRERRKLVVCRQAALRINEVDSGRSTL